MEQQQYISIKEKSGHFSSWALWNTDPDKFYQTSIIEESVELLHSKYVIVGFNATRVLHGEWNNFHMLHQGGRDRWLADLFNEKPYKGSYMTDLLKIDGKDGIIKITKAGDVESYFFQPSNAEALSKSRGQKLLFKSEMELIGANEETTFILIGELTSRYFDCFTDFSYTKKCHLPHYAGRLTKEEWLKKCNGSLMEIDSI